MSAESHVAEVAEATTQPAHRYLTIIEAAAYIRMAEITMRRMIAEGQVTAYRPRRGKIFVDRDELDALMRASANAQPKRRRRSKSAS